jgi:nucleotide-binding universal stress UspA family protein
VTTIVVGVDGSTSSAVALRWAAAAARRRSAELVVLNAYLAPLAYVGPEEAIARIDPDLHHVRLRHLEDHIEAAQVDLDGLEVHRRLHPGRAVDGLLEAAQEADLLVLGARGSGGFHGLRLGGTAEHCARHAHSPVVIVPSHLPPTTGRVVVGIDGSATAREAASWAVDEARGSGAELELVAVYQPYDARGPFGGEFMRLASPGSTERFRRASDRHIYEAAAAIPADAGVPVRSMVLAGHPAEVLVERAQLGDLLVVGRRGGEGFPGLRLGSVTRQVLHHADRPVAVIPSERAQ